MATNFLSLRSSAAPSISAVNLTGSAITTSTITVSTLNLQSTTVSLGQSTNQTYNNFSNGSYLTWATAKSAMTSANKTVQSANGLYQMLVANATSGLFLSSDSGITWSTLSGGLPTLTGSAYWSDGAISANGQYITLSIYGGSLWMSADYGRTFALTNQPTPNIWLPLNGNTTDSMGLSVVTTPGTVPGYVTINYPGYTSQAVNLLNTAGGTATRYIRGTWTGAANFTVSLWFNVQTLGVQQQALFVAYAGNYVIALNASNQITWYIPSGGSGLIAVTGPVVSINTWYYVSAIFQTNGTCSLYVNNSLAGTYTNLGGVGSYTTTAFAIGTYDTSTPSAFNGYIDDLRITNSVSTYVPIPHLQPNIWMPFENSTADLGSNAITSTVTGSVSYVPGIIGLNAVNIANTPGGAATNFIQGNISVSGINVITVSAWFNAQSFPLTGASVIIGIGGISIGTYIGITLSTTGSLIFYFLNSSSVGITIGSVPSISLNTWYHVYLIFQQTGTCIAYLNSTLIGSVAGSALFGSNLIYDYTLGRNVANNDVAFNGYIDDFRVYNAAIPIHALFPQNYRSLALSGNGQYALAAAASGWVVGSSNSSQTWSKQAVNVGTQNDFIQPNLSDLGSSKTSLTTSSWTINGVTWIASSSSIFSEFTAVSNVFNNSGLLEWVPLSNTYTTSGNSSGQTTSVQTIGTVTGEWLQIQSSVPLIMASYQFATGNVVARTPKTYYIVGSNDGSTWSPIQYGSAGAVTTTASHTIVPGIITVNSASTQIFGSSTITTTIYATTTNTYTYFRLICLSNYSGSNDVVSLGEWYVNFVRPLTNSRPSASMLSLNHSGQYQLVATGPVAGSIMPNSTLATGNTWTSNGVTWRSSGSSSYVSIPNIYYVLFNTAAAAEWVSSAAVYNTSGNTSGFNTTFYTNGSSTSTIQGDYIQLQSSIPLVMSSYQLANSGEVINFIKSFFIVGSNDGTTWYAIQYAIVAAQPTAVASTLLSNTILVNSASAQTFGTSTMTTTTYTGTTNSYTYFRMIIVSTYNPSAYYVRFTEWLINFQNSVSYSSNYGSTWLNTSSVVSNESVTLSASGQYTLSTNSVAPFVRLTLDDTNVDAQGVLVPATGAGTVTYSTSIKAVGTHSAIFNNTPGPSAPANYLLYTVPSVLNTPPVLTMMCWAYPTAFGSANWPVPFALCNATSSNGPVFFFQNGGLIGVGTPTTTNTAGITLLSSVTASVNTWYHLAAVYSNNIISLYINGTLNATVSYSGLLCLGGGGNMTHMIVGGNAPTSGGSFRGNVDDVRIYTSALNADEINGLFKNPALTQTVAVSNSYLPITSYTKPVLPGITANVVDTAVSQTGQYMVLITSSTTNNVYYSTDFGTTFTALTIGTAAMVSCSISYDGSYLTVESATTVHTLNRNTRGFSVAVGNQAGFVNQAQNAIAIGDKAGRTNQSANSIVLNATGNALDAVAPGFYVAPIATAASSSATSFGLLGYGTDNQVTQTNLTVLSNGYVGIGASGPTASLQVNGSTSIYGMFRLVNNTATTSNEVSMGYFNNPSASFAGAAGSAWCHGIAAFGTGANNFGFGCVSTGLIMSMLSSGNVGIGVAAPSTKLHIYDSSGTNVIRIQTSSVDNAYIASTYDYIFISANYNIAGGRENTGRGSSQIVMYSYANSGGLITFNTSPSVNTAVQESMRITSTGNVGIGITNPSSLLHVAGNIYSSTNISAPSISGSYYAGGDQRGVTNYFKPNSQPAGTFTVGFYGGAASGTWADGIQLNTYTDGSGGNQNLVLFQKSGIAMRIYQGGWQSSSSYSTYADVSFQAGSDIRLKENIQDVSDARGMIDMLHPKTFYFIKDEKKIRQIGFIAQEVRDYYPQFVTGTESETQYLSMEYGKMSPIAIAACKDLYVENDALRARIDILESRLAALERLLTK